MRCRATTLLVTSLTLGILVSACGSSGPVGNTGQKRAECTSVGDCEDGFVCVEQQCLRVCNEDRECDAPAVCVDGACELREGTLCRDASRCNDYPTANAACFLPECRDGQCKYPVNTGAECGSPTCEGGDVRERGTCDGAGACIPGSLTDCAAYSCVDGACRTSCTDTSDCADGYVCTANGGGRGECVPIGGSGEPCTEGVENACSDGLHCENGVCCAEGKTCCSDAADCPNNLGCNPETAFCYEDCVRYSTNHCSDSETEYCLPEDDVVRCVAKKQEADNCVENANECLGNLVCVEGKCVGSECSTNDDCTEPNQCECFNSDCTQRRCTAQPCGLCLYTTTDTHTGEGDCVLRLERGVSDPTDNCAGEMLGCKSDGSCGFRDGQGCTAVDACINRCDLVDEVCRPLSELGGDCNRDRDCTVGDCISGTCKGKAGEGPCDPQASAGAQCEDGLICSTSGLCAVPGGPGDGCNPDASQPCSGNDLVCSGDPPTCVYPEGTAGCADNDAWCAGDQAVCAQDQCYSGPLGAGGSCDDATDCAGSNLECAGDSSNKTCRYPNGATGCGSGTDAAPSLCVSDNCANDVCCGAGSCCVDNAPCGSLKCNSSTHACYNDCDPNNTHEPSDDDRCSNTGHHCYSGDGQCYGSENGQKCDVDGECASGRCRNNTCVRKLNDGEGPCGDPGDCASGYCDNGICCDGGTCCNGSDQSQCGEYSCNTTTYSCRTSCASDGHCQSGYYCFSNDTCDSPRPPGSGCSRDDECTCGCFNGTCVCSSEGDSCDSRADCDVDCSYCEADYCGGQDCYEELDCRSTNVCDCDIECG